MKPFKQFYTEQQTLLENRRTFLRTLFGGAAAMAVSNPVRAANAVANAASAPWIKMSLEQDFSMYDYAKVSADEIANLIAMKGKYTPGVSADGGITVNYNDSTVDMVEVYVKPGTPMYKQVAARISDDPDVDAPGGFDFEKQVFDNCQQVEANFGDATFQKQKDFTFCVFQSINNSKTCCHVDY